MVSELFDGAFMSAGMLFPVILILGEGAQWAWSVATGALCVTYAVVRVAGFYKLGDDRGALEGDPKRSND